MKVLICFGLFIASCSAGIFNGYGGNSLQEIEIEPQKLQQVHLVEEPQQYDQSPQQDVELIQIQQAPNVDAQVGWQSQGSGGYGGSYQSQPQIIKVIHEQEPSSFGGGGYPSHGNSIEGHGHGGQSHSQVQIIKVISEPSSLSFGGNGYNGYAEHGSASGKSQSYAPSFKSQNTLDALIPQILKIIFEDAGSSDGGGDGGYHHAGSGPGSGSANIGQLAQDYGSSGTTKITRLGKLGNDYYKSGRVIEKGHLEITQVKSGKNSHGGSSSGGGGSGGFNLSSLFNLFRRRQ